MNQLVHKWVCHRNCKSSQQISMKLVRQFVSVRIKVPCYGFLPICITAKGLYNGEWNTQDRKALISDKAYIHVVSGPNFVFEVILPERFLWSFGKRCSGSCMQHIFYILTATMKHAATSLFMVMMSIRDFFCVYVCTACLLVAWWECRCLEQ